jgi:hypothetical protein
LLILLVNPDKVIVKGAPKKDKRQKSVEEKYHHARKNASILEFSKGGIIEKTSKIYIQTFYIR